MPPAVRNKSLAPRLFDSLTNLLFFSVITLVLLGWGIMEVYGWPVEESPKNERFARPIPARDPREVYLYLDTLKENDLLAWRALAAYAHGAGYQANLYLARLDSLPEEERVDYYRRALFLYADEAVNLELAALLEELGCTEEAREAYRQALPHPEAIAAVRRLEEETMAVRLLVEKNLSQEALKILENMPAEETGRPETALLYGKTLVNLGRYGEALPWLQRCSGEEALSLQALALEQLGRYGEAIQAYTRLGERGLYGRGRILERQGNLQEAAQALADAPEAEARWRGALLWEMLGREEKALEVYRRLAEEEAAPADDAAARAALLEKRRNCMEASVSMLDMLPGESAWRERFGLHPAVTFMPDPPAGEALPFVERALALRRQGRCELEEIEIAIGRKLLASARDLLALGEGYLALGEYYQAARYGIRVYIFHPCRRACLLAYQKAFWEEVQAVSAAYDLDPYLVLAVMREESMYRPAVISWAGACGLMQVMPATGKGIAAALGQEYHDDLLFDAATNLRFGAYYLHAMLRQFGDLDQALAAYNGGPGNVQRWLQSKLYREAADFPAAVTFIETREYITRVRTTYGILRLLYAAE